MGTKVLAAAQENTLGPAPPFCSGPHFRGWSPPGGQGGFPAGPLRSPLLPKEARCFPCAGHQDLVSSAVLFEVSGITPASFRVLLKTAAALSTLEAA